jgi:hypothetical protein
MDAAVGVALRLCVRALPMIFLSATLGHVARVAVNATSDKCIHDVDD